MIIFKEDETLCMRENNRCKRRNKCKRYLAPRENHWEADYYGEFGQFCVYFVKLPKPEKND